MEIQNTIQVGVLCNIVQLIPESAAGDTVKIEIRRLSDGYTWNFSTLAFQNASNLGDMNLVNDIWWKQTFTPPTVDTYLIKINDQTLDVKHGQALKAVGQPAPAGITGTQLTTLAEVRAFMKLPSGSTGDDALLETLIAAETKKIQEETRRDLIAQDYTEYYDGKGNAVLMLKNYPINSLTSLKDDVDRAFGSDSAIDSDSIVQYADEGMIKLDGDYFNEGLKNIQVVYNAGYTTIPADLNLACVQRVVADYIEAKGQANALKGDFVYKPGKLRDEAKTVVRRYVRFG